MLNILAGLAVLGGIGYLIIKLMNSKEPAPLDSEIKSQPKADPVKAPAAVVATNGTLPVMAKAQYGKGKVLIVGDPWLYNEYLDGRKIPNEYQNYEAAQQLIKYLLKNAK